ncbi:PP2C family protein-serine/threonine phosphatase [Actinomadura rupiterrae]|uniref:PP2C family protein-serine/threonine phosphatase n=1 Tax=Actinomadura rupiterrae TaxID=559627 RepID=UPI0020A2F20A|nr:GAF domain-containing SpoIIE family protein phosphatase [Actinomadura rupiterrae]MCP2342433.1 serine phosphatase RsbU (regulator of sigma subunit) [Actinomadura rupiterrae]
MRKSTARLGEVIRKLENIQAFTDEAFSRMNVEEFLDTLLERVQETLEVDTAAVLLLDRPGGHLVATAARGLEEEVVQAARVPVGQGFAGRIAAERRPVVIEDVPTAHVFNTLLIERGLRAMLGVPLISAGRLLGVLHVGTTTPRRFTEEDTELLQVAAGRAATAVQALLGQSERAAALELQRSLVPAAPPALPGLELAARYRPGAADVGGDWYDVFPLPSGDVGIVMGDVAGHGLGAAVVMGRMRSALRAYALETTDPAVVLNKLDRKMQHFEPTATATVLYAVWDPARERMRLSSAGHYPPILALPDGPSSPVEMPSDVLIGLDDTVPRRSVTLELPPGAVLAFYTDGLIERRNASISDGVARLCAAMRAGPPELVSASVMGAMIGRHQAEDDVALLVMRRAAEGIA